MLWYQIPYLILVTVGFVGCAYFVVTWWRGVTDRWSLEAFDAGGWVILLLAVFGLVLANLGVYGMPYPSTKSRGIQSLLVYAVVDAVVAVRLVLWRRIRRAATNRMGE